MSPFLCKFAKRNDKHDRYMDALIRDLALILVVAGVVTLLFKKLRQPLVLGYIVAGFLVSPHMPWLASVVDKENIQTWADIGVMFLLFSLGLDFSFKRYAVRADSRNSRGRYLRCAGVPRSSVRCIPAAVYPDRNVPGNDLRSDPVQKMGRCVL